VQTLTTREVLRWSKIGEMCARKSGVREKENCCLFFFFPPFEKNAKSSDLHKNIRYARSFAEKERDSEKRSGLQDRELLHRSDVQLQWINKEIKYIYTKLHVYKS
jgi:hypothetical protein